MKLVSDTVKNNNIYHIDNVEKIEPDDIFHRYDVFEVKEIREIFDQLGTPAKFLSTMIIHCDEFIDDVEFVGLPLWLEHSRKMWNLEEFNKTKCKTNYCFNFMINKKQINRYLCIKLVELFKFKNFIYTWSGTDNYFDCSETIQEHRSLGKLSPLDRDQFAQVLSPIKLDPVFYLNNQEKYTSSDNSAVDTYGGNRNSWDWGCNKLFLESAVSLITESLKYQKATTFTEKTLYSILGASFPIWVGGGNRQAEIFNKLGLDTFDDIINHDYQYYDTLLERCVYAFEFNKKILTDLDYAKSVRNKNIGRLVNNRNLVLKGKLNEFIEAELQKYYPQGNPISVEELITLFDVDFNLS